MTPLRLSLFCLLLYGFLVWLIPWRGFVTVDLGANYVQAIQLARVGRPTIPMGPLLSPVAKEFFPWRYAETPPGPLENFDGLHGGWVVERGGRFLLTYPIAFAWISSLGYRFLGEMGLFVLPILAGAITVWGTYRLAIRLGLRRPWLPAVIVGLGSPLPLYSSLLWGHAPATAASVLAFLFLHEAIDRRLTESCANRLPGGNSWRPGRWLAAGLAAGAAGAFRNEGLILAVLLFVLIPALEARARWRGTLVFALGAALSLSPTFVYNRVVFGSLLNPTQSSRVTNYHVSIGGGEESHSRVMPLVVRLRNAATTLHETLFVCDNLKFSVQIGFTLCCCLAILPVCRAVWVHNDAFGIVFAGRGLILVTVLFFCFALLVKPQQIPGLFPCCPFLLFSVPALISPASWRGCPFDRLRTLVVLAFLFLVALRGSPGWQWGGRYILVIQPLLALFATEVFEKLETLRRKEPIRVHVVALVCVGFGMTWVSVRDLVSEQAFRQDFEQKVVESFGAESIAFDSWWFSWENSPIAFDREMFFIDRPERFGRLVDYLSERGCRKVSLMIRKSRAELEACVREADQHGARAIRRVDATLPFGLKWHAVLFEIARNASIGSRRSPSK